jgi:hypothetical protein
MVVSWGTQSIETGSVLFGTAIPYSNTIQETTPDTIHHVELTGLLINSHYFYKVVAGTDSASGDFWTAPNSSDSFEIVAYGDSHFYSTVHRRIAQRYMQYAPRLILHTGDRVNLGQYWEWNTFFFGPAEDAIIRTPMIACVGNHDADWGSPPNYAFNLYKRLMKYPGNELYFSFDYGPIHVIILDCISPSQYGTDTPQSSWFQDDLASTQQPYRIVVFHFPPYASGAGNSSSMSIRQNWCPIFRENHVQMVINGHQHFYERCEPGDGIVYVISGGGGGLLDTPTYDSSYVQDAHRAYHFLRLHVGPDSIEVTAIDTSNAILDRFSIFPWRPPIPEPIQDVTILQDSIGIRLSWGAVQQDTTGTPLVVEQYRIYRNTETSDFLPDSLNYLNATPDTTFRDTSILSQTGRAFYRVTAIAPNP